MSRHTPGPWASTAHFRSEGAPLFVATMTRSGNENCIICRIRNEVSGRPLDDEDFCNARLIAAAPDLLEALQGFIEGAEAMGWNTDKARAAIAKATGEQA